MSIFSSFATPWGLAIVIAKGTLLLAIAFCGAFLLRRAPAVTRHLVWLSAIVGVLLLPVLSQLAPVQVAVLPVIEVAMRVAPSSPVASTALDLAQTPIPESAPVVPVSSQYDPHRYSIPSMAKLAIGLWLGVAAILMAWLIAGMLSVHRIMRGSRPLDSFEWHRALREAAGRLQLTGAPRLVMSDQVEMPFACDPLAPAIVLPVSAGEWSDDRRRAVLLHELAHVRRRDLVGHTIANIACAVYWFHPMVWMAARRLRVESELASDDVVLDNGVRPSDYAEHLLEMVTSLSRGAPTIALAMARPKDFEGRLVAILDRANRRRAFGGAQVGAMLGLLGFMTISIAAVMPVHKVGSTLVATTRPQNAAQPSLTNASPNTSPTAETHLTMRGEPAAFDEPKIIGRPLSDVTVQLLLRFGTAGVINPMMMILRDADTLHLTGKQADSVATLNRWYRIHLESIWRPVAQYYVTQSAAANQSTLNRAQYDEFSRAPQASIDLLLKLAPQIYGLLTAEQRSGLAPGIVADLDPAHLADLRAGTSDSPTGVFELYAGGGRRGGARVGGAGADGDARNATGRAGRGSSRE